MHTDSRNKDIEDGGVPVFKKPSLIVNIAAGSASDITQEACALFERFGYPKPIIHLCEPSQLSDALEAIHTDATDLLIIYGGDGTCKAGAIAARKAGIPLIPLPGGTMNMLPKAVYGLDDWAAALELALSQAAPHWQAAGFFNENIFLCGAILGDPITMAEARESLREGDVIEAVKQLPEIMSAISHGEEFEFKVDGRVFETDANGLQIYCPFMTSGATKDDAFEIASVPHLSVSELIGIGGQAIAQDWRDSAHIKTALARKIEILGQGAFDILLDGEPERVSCPLTIKIEPKGVLVMAPKRKAEEP